MARFMCVRECAVVVFCLCPIMTPQWRGKLVLRRGGEQIARRKSWEESIGTPLLPTMTLTIRYKGTDLTGAGCQSWTITTNRTLTLMDSIQAQTRQDKTQKGGVAEWASNYVASNQVGIHSSCGPVRPPLVPARLSIAEYLVCN